MEGEKGEGGERYRFQTLVHRPTTNKNGVGIVLDKSLKDGVVDIKRQGNMIILVKLLVGDLVFNVISAYTPQIGLNESIKRQSVNS
jgi:hypothetical protein